MWAGICTRCPAPGIRPGNRSAQGKRPFRIRRCFDRVEIVVAGPRVIGVPRKHGLKCGDDLIRTGLRSPIRFPEVPGPQIHHRFRKQRGRIGIIGVPLRHRSHGLRIGLIESLALGPFPAHIPCGQRLDVGLLFANWHDPPAVEPSGPFRWRDVRSSSPSHY